MKVRGVCDICVYKCGVSVVRIVCAYCEYSVLYVCCVVCVSRCVGLGGGVWAGVCVCPCVSVCERPPMFPTPPHGATLGA